MGVAFVPRPYQSYAMERIIEEDKIALFLDMGLGKTSTTLFAVDVLINERFEVGKVLVIAPLRVAESTWSDEKDKWEGLYRLSISRVLGGRTERLRALQKDADIYITNRENVPWLVEHYGKDFPFDMVVIDESSSFKNPSSKRFKALRKVRPRVKRMVLLTGTPSPNSLLDLWSQIYLLDMGERLGKTITGYRQKYFQAGASNGHVVYDWRLREGADREIYHRIEDIAVSMKSEDYVSLPNILKNEVRVKLSDKDMKLYKRMERDMIVPYLDTELVASSAGVLSGKLLQLASGAVYDEEQNVLEVHDKKIEALKELLEANDGKSVLVFYWFKHDLERLQRAFPTGKVLHGRQEIKDWNEGRIPLLFVHPASAGHGLNLQYGGHIIVWFSLTWSLELYQQANKRLHRSGQAENVIIHHLVAQNTIDEAVMNALEGKRQGQDAMLEAVKARIKEYDDAKV